MDSEIERPAKLSLEDLSEADRRLLREIIEDTVGEVLAAAGLAGD